MKINLMLACFFCVLFTGTHFANKYVLSELRFTYPTIFQGWQTLVGVVMFRALLSTGHIDGLLHGKDWHECALWLPGAVCFLVSIYSGSRALANLPIPVFFVMQNIILVFKATADLICHQQLTGMYSYIMLMMSLISAFATAKTDPQYNPEGYLWMCVHIISLGILECYTNLMKGRLKLGVIVLAPCSYFLGDALEASKFPYLYFAKFYVGCILSGVLGMLMNLSAIRLHELKDSSSILHINTVQGAAKILCSGMSLAFYDMWFSHSFAFFIAVNLLCSFGYCESSSQRRRESYGTSHYNEVDNQVDFKDFKEGELPQFLKRHDLQQDMIRMELH